MITISINSFTVFGREIPFYGILMVVGFGIAALTAIPKAKKLKLPLSEVAYSAIFAIIGGILGAKLLSILTSINYIIEYKLSFLDVIQNGFVFYGGLIGGAFALFLYTKIYKLKTSTYFDLYAAGTALGHAFGRIGCLFSGCCFGIETNSAFSVIYTSSVDPNTPLNTPLLPIPLIEAMCLVGIFILSELVFYGIKKPTASTYCYGFCYSITRFTLEFFRGDEVRGLWGYLSTSQYISISIFILCSVLLAVQIYKSRKKPV